MADMKLNRRTFLKRIGQGVAGAAIVPLAPQGADIQKVQIPTEPDRYCGTMMYGTAPVGWNMSK